ncbi:MAG: DUF4445 domain-containing protein [Dehalococcoidia bacterium]|nr:DUF4445 domain-containing protein [Dehalococcoidia bacterium]
MEKDNKISIYTVRFLPFEIDVDIESGTSILDAISKAELSLSTTCGGEGTCGDCMVEIITGNYQSKTSAALPQKLHDERYVLACLTDVQDNLVVKLPQYQQLSIRGIADSSFFDENRDNISGIYEINPLVKRIELKIPDPTIDNNYSDLKRLQLEIRTALKIENADCDYSVIKKLASAVRGNHGKIAAVLFKTDKHWTIINVEPDTAAKNIYGISCDIGTTTVALNLVDLANGEIICTVSDYNQQLKCGEDIISRINYAQKPGRLRELHELIIRTINNLIEKVTETAPISSSEIYSVSVSGNTTMMHLFLNLEPRYIREAPYVPTVNQVPIILARELGLKVNPEGRVQFAPAVGSYVGGDITAGLLCTPLLRSSEKISLFCDVGTNGEIVIGNKDWLMTCACSAGPAFEGSGTKCGMPASEGAIERFIMRDTGEMEYEVINGSKPKGLCGSGLVDLLAELYINGYIDRNGKFNTDKGYSRIIEDESGRGFLVEKGANCYWGKDIIVTENDISTLIRTKGAMFSACSLVLKNVGITFDDLDAFYIAGGFGRYLTIENAIRIGFLPDIERTKFHYLGNSSLLGAYLILIAEKNREIVDEMADKMTYIELNTEPSYMNEYTGALFLPHTDMVLFPSVKRALSK